MPTKERERWRITMAKQKSVFNATKKVLENQEMPARPWAQQAEKESSLEMDEQNKIVKANMDINVEQIVHTELPYASVILDSKWFRKQTLVNKLR